MPSLFVRRYDPDADRPMIQSWLDYHAGEAVPFPVLLPPLGVVVELDGEPSAALWCFECAGVDMCWLELPVSRPGMSLDQVLSAFRFAIKAIVELAGKGWTIPTTYHNFRAVPNPVCSRLLERMGFTRESPNEYIPMILTVPPP